MSNVKEISSQDFQQEVLDSEQAVVVDFFSTWCGPCRMLAPMLDQLATAYEGRLKIVKVNAQTELGLARQYAITGVPTLISFADGRETDRIVGLLPPAELKVWFDQAAGVTV